MKMLWCWRCKMEVPMLDEEESRIAGDLYGKCFRDVANHENMTLRFKPLLNYYNDLSGWDETNPNAIMHHSIQLYGPPCENCGKPYRTDQTSFCAACGNKRESSPTSLQ